MLDKIDMPAIKDTITKHFSGCQVGDCRKHSIGIVCSYCSRFACNTHVYFRMAKRFSPVCAACVVDSHPELLEEP
jgi:hypothetical protein